MAAAKTAKDGLVSSFSCTQFDGHDFVDDFMDWTRCVCAIAAAPSDYGQKTGRTKKSDRGGSA
jgi:hypothetical protein